MSLGLFLIALLAAPTSAPVISEAPNITVVPSIVEVRRSEERREIIPLRIEVRQGRDLLWRGALRVQSNSNSAYTQALTQPAEGCMEPGYRNTARSALTVDVSRFSPGDQVDNLNLHVRWERPVEPASPACQRNSRIIELNQTVTLPAGKETVVTGDAGLSVSLSRP